MTAFSRLLRFRLPMTAGVDVRAVQLRLRELGLTPVEVDGVFGPQTVQRVRAFQEARGLKVDGVVGSVTWNALFAGPSDLASASAANGADAFAETRQALASLADYRSRFSGSCRWRISRAGVEVEGEPAALRTPGEPATVRRVWRDFSGPVAEWSGKLGVPAELILATICTESGGRPDARREEPGFTSWRATPHRISIGLMQTLVSTARETLGRDDIDVDWLLQPANSIRAGAAYMARQRPQTRFDPILVACAYNAGGVYEQRGAANRWKLRQYPIGTAKHADRYAAWFGDALAVFDEMERAGDGAAIPPCSFHRLLA